MPVLHPIPVRKKRSVFEKHLPWLDKPHVSRCEADHRVRIVLLHVSNCFLSWIIPWISHYIMV